jgi:hypothetical protein
VPTEHRWSRASMTFFCVRCIGMALIFIHARSRPAMLQRKRCRGSRRCRPPAMDQMICPPGACEKRLGGLVDCPT